MKPYLCSSDALRLATKIEIAVRTNLRSPDMCESIFHTIRHQILWVFVNMKVMSRFSTLHTLPAHPHNVSQTLLAFWPHMSMTMVELDMWWLIHICSTPLSPISHCRACSQSVINKPFGDTTPVVSHGCTIQTQIHLCQTVC